MAPLFSVLQPSRAPSQAGPDQKRTVEPLGGIDKASPPHPMPQAGAELVQPAARSCSPTAFRPPVRLRHAPIRCARNTATRAGRSARPAPPSRPGAVGYDRRPSGGVTAKRSRPCAATGTPVHPTARTCVEIFFQTNDEAASQRDEQSRRVTASFPDLEGADLRNRICRPPSDVPDAARKHGSSFLRGGRRVP